VAIEATNGLVVDRLLAAGHPVIPVHATAFHAARPRWSAAGARSDPGDSYKLADYLRTDGHRLRRLQPPDAATRELQALIRLRADHLAAKTTTSNQLWALLGAHWPPLGPSGSAWHPRSRWTSSPPTQPHRPPPVSPNSSWRRSAAGTPTAAARPSPSC
jgi:transposase